MFNWISKWASWWLRALMNMSGARGERVQELTEPMPLIFEHAPVTSWLRGLR